MKKEFEKEQNDNQIDDAFLDMPDMEDDEKFRQWLVRLHKEEDIDGTDRVDLVGWREISRELYWAGFL